MLQGPTKSGDPPPEGMFEAMLEQALESAGEVFDRTFDSGGVRPPRGAIDEVILTEIREAIREYLAAQKLGSEGGAALATLEPGALETHARALFSTVVERLKGAYERGVGGETGATTATPEVNEAPRPRPGLDLSALLDEPEDEEPRG